MYSEQTESESTEQTIGKALEQISEKELSEANYPVITKVPRKIFSDFNEGKKKIEFWKEIFNTDNFVKIGDETPVKSEDIYFVLHSEKDAQDQDTRFTAVTTEAKAFLSDPNYMINYQYHGKPCERRIHGQYPNIYFWDFYDQLSLEEQEKYPIPDRNWRENFYKKQKPNTTSS
jgi:hypothetical protein